MLPYVIVIIVTAVITFGIAWLLTTIFQHKIEAQNPYIRFVDVNDNTSDPAQWGKNWPREYDGYLAHRRGQQHAFRRVGKRSAAEPIGEGSVAEADVRGLRVCDRLQCSPRPCVHAL